MSSYGRLTRNGFTPAEVEFLAENETITIVPTQKMGAVHLINGTYGPFKPPHKQEVPLWVAITLKRKQKCQIAAPSWMDVEELREKIEEEKANPLFVKMPFHFMEVAHAILDCASDDIPQADEVRTLLKDLRECRQAKARKGLEALDHYYLQMNNLGAMEINEIRPFFTRAFNELRRLQSTQSSDDSQSATPAPTFSSGRTLYD
ncbi:GINS complex, PSF2 component [Phlyctochytrium arcticum]|nr:GINS complex, PSF2 component [Phlyctochytrium arcticum]